MLALILLWTDMISIIPISSLLSNGYLNSKLMILFCIFTFLNSKLMILFCIFTFLNSKLMILFCIFTFLNSKLMILFCIFTFLNSKLMILFCIFTFRTSKLMILFVYFDISHCDVCLETKTRTLTRSSDVVEAIQTPAGVTAIVIRTHCVLSARSVQAFVYIWNEPH